MKSVAEDPVASGQAYTMRVSRLTVDKLGVKLYDTVSAVVAELIANAYDADAENVTVRLPLNTLLTRKDPDGTTEDAGFTLEVVDNGHGMTPREAIEHYLLVGRDRRAHEEQGGRSRNKKRAVMGRKGIGKLAPFGICREIEVISAGGEKSDRGYVVTHFSMDFDQIRKDTDDDVTFEPGPLDRTYVAKSGTTIRLRRFLPKRVPDAETFHRQIARRFVVARPDFTIVVEDTRAPEDNPPVEVSPLSVPTLEGTRIDVSEYPIMTEDGRELRANGWLGLATTSYKNEEMAGVRIYARGKIVASTRDFEQPAGFTGEFMMRSYLVGQIEAEWLDLDDGEDLIRTDRQGILWDSDDGRALREWGAKLIREIAKRGREPQRVRVRDAFLKKCNFADRAKARFKDPEVVEAALDLARQIGSFAAEDELEDAVYLDDLAEVILSVAPHKALMEAFQRFTAETTGKAATLEQLHDLFGKTRVAEMASYGQIAVERVRVIRELEKIVRSDSDENALQELLAGAPWLIDATWSVISTNRALSNVRDGLEQFLEKRLGRKVVLALGYDRKRPDFTLVSIGHLLNVVEIKAAGHVYSDADFKRMVNYVAAFDEFFEKNADVRLEFPRGYRILLVADDVKLTDEANRYAYEPLLVNGKVRQRTWNDFLGRAKTAHEQFLLIEEGAQRMLAPVKQPNLVKSVVGTHRDAPTAVSRKPRREVSTKTEPKRRRKRTTRRKGRSRGKPSRG